LVHSAVTLTIFPYSQINYEIAYKNALKKVKNTQLITFNINSNHYTFSLNSNWQAIRCPKTWHSVCT